MVLDLFSGLYVVAFRVRFFALDCDVNGFWVGCVIDSRYGADGPASKDHKRDQHRQHHGEQGRQPDDRMRHTVGLAIQILRRPERVVIANW